MLHAVLWSSPLSCQPQDARNFLNLPLNMSSHSLTIQVLLRLEGCCFSTMLIMNWMQKDVVNYSLSTVLLCGGKKPNRTTKTMKNGGCRLMCNNIYWFNKNNVSPLPCSLLLCPLPTLLSGYTNFLAFPGVTQRRPGIIFMPGCWCPQQ